MAVFNPNCLFSQNIKYRAYYSEWWRIQGSKISMGPLDHAEKGHKKITSRDSLTNFLFQGLSPPEFVDPLLSDEVKPYIECI